MKWLDDFLRPLFLAWIIIAVPVGCGSDGGPATDIEDFDEPELESGGEESAEFDAAEEASAKKESE